MSEPYFHEFLYRGRHPGDTTPPAYHVGICAMTADPFGGPPQHHERTLNMSQAEEAGWSLPDAISAINAEALRDLEAATETIAARDEELAEANVQIEGLTATVAAQARTIRAATLVIVDRDAEIQALKEAACSDGATA